MPFKAAGHTAVPTAGPYREIRALKARQQAPPGIALVGGSCLEQNATRTCAAGSTASQQAASLHVLADLLGTQSERTTCGELRHLAARLAACRSCFASSLVIGRLLTLSVSPPTLQVLLYVRRRSRRLLVQRGRHLHVFQVLQHPQLSQLRRVTVIRWRVHGQRQQSLRLPGRLVAEWDHVQAHVHGQLHFLQQDAVSHIDEDVQRLQHEDHAAERL